MAIFMDFPDSFTTEEEDSLVSEFLSKGYVLREAPSPNVLYDLRKVVVELACELLSVDYPDDEDNFLVRIHELVDVVNLNEFRMAIYQRMNGFDWFRPTYFAMGKPFLEKIVGNELAMQNRVNFSIQLPQDLSSLIGLHSDSFSGETPFQVVQWVPLMSTFSTNAMYLLPPDKNREFFPQFAEIAKEGGLEAVFDQVEPFLEWVKVPFGSVMIFSPNLFHGNVVNQTENTRWSMNTRFTGLFTPYTDVAKNLGTFYLPVTMKPVSVIGANYTVPRGLSRE